MALNVQNTKEVPQAKWTTTKVLDERLQSNFIGENIHLSRRRAPSMMAIALLAHQMSILPFMLFLSRTFLTCQLSDSLLLIMPSWELRCV